jgi:FkbM family methyltransferase
VVSLLKRIARRAQRELWVALRYDPITRQRIHPRPDLVTLGDAGGRWTVPAALLSQEATIYCVGCGEDISFDLALIRRFACVVHGFDPTPRAVKHVERVAAREARYVFHPIGIWSKSEVVRFFAPQDEAHVSHSIVNAQQTAASFDAQVRRLSEVMADLGHVGLTLLKLDIEGAEYEVLQTLLEDAIHPLILCVEFDEYYHPKDADFRLRIKRAIVKLKAVGYRLVYTGGNANYTFVHGR